MLDTTRRVAAAAAEYLALRERVFRRIDAAGVHRTGCRARTPPISIVDRYFKLKLEGRL